MRVSRRTICNILKNANVRHYNKPIKGPELRLRIAELFFRECLPDDTIHEVLNAEGFAIAFRVFVQVRKDMGIKRRLSIAEYAAREEEYQFIVRRELNSGQIDNYGRTMLYAHFRSAPSLQMIVSR